MAPQPADFAVIVRDLRRRMKISQQQFAARLHVSLPTVHRWERAKTEPDAPVRHIIAQLLAELGPGFADLAAALSPAAASTGVTQATPSRRRARTAASDDVTPMDNRTMEAMLWRAACSIRGEKDAPKFKDFILPLVFLKRLSDVFDDEVARLAAQLGNADTARSIVAKDHKLVRFFLPPEASWSALSGRQPQPAAGSIGERITTALRAVARLNPSLQGVIDTVDFNQTSNGEREISDAALARLIEILTDPRFRLGLADVEPDFLGRAYEYLLRKFAESQGQSAGEFFTPKEVGWLMARLMAPAEGESVYDPCCGSGGLLIKCALALREHTPHPARPLQLAGQELTGSSYALAHMNMVIHDISGDDISGGIKRGNTMANPKHLAAGRLRPFDIVVTNPMWNQKNIDAAVYETDPFGRFETRGGFAPASSADWAWMQHVAASLAPAGRAAVVIDTGAAFRGSGSSSEAKEKNIRRWFIEHDLIEAVILLPDNLFYNTTAAGLILLLRPQRTPPRAGGVLMVNASAEFTKGRPKNELTDAGTQRILAAYRDWAGIPGLARPVPLAELAQADFNLSPSRFVTPLATESTDDIQSLLDQLASADADIAAASGDLAQVFASLGFRPGGRA